MCVLLLTSPTKNGRQRKPKQKAFVNDGNVVFFHFETTGFGSDAEIIQIAARCRGATFNVYILPDGDIDPRVRLTRISKAPFSSLS